MDKNSEVQGILRQLPRLDPSHGGNVTAADLAALAQQPKNADSIFSQVFERIVHSRAINVGSGPEALTNLEILLDSFPDPLLVLSGEGRIDEANPLFCTDFGYARDELVGISVLDLIPDNYRQGFKETLLRIETEGPGAQGLDYVVAFRAVKKDGSVESMDCVFAVIEGEGASRVLAVIRDFSADKALIEELKESKDNYLALTESITEAIFRIDSDFSILFVNSGVKNTFGFDPDELVGKPLSCLFPEEVFHKHELDFRKYFFVDDQDRTQVGLKRTIELLGVTKHRGVAPVEISFGNSKDFRGRTLTCIIREISQRKTMERRLRHLAYHDKLTGLGNRDLFNEDMKTVFQGKGPEPGSHSALLFMDLDGFKHINDTIGHAAGDELLVETARRIRFCLRDSDSAYRFGGDEFVVLLPQLAEGKDVTIVAERILNAVREPYELSAGSAGRARVAVGVSIGAALMPDHGSTQEEAVKSADIAMYCSKEAGRNRVTVYDPTLATKSTDNWRLEQDMRMALVSGEFHMYYQPIVDRDGTLLGLEALIRWLRDGKPVHSPQQFIPRAEENGMIIPLGSWVLRRALMDLRRLEDSGFRRIYMSINVSTRQLELPDFLESLTDAIESTGADCSRVKLEITETTLLRDADGAYSKILGIKERFPGIMLAIDDFGTGYSSLAYLSRLPVDSLKIDISFVRALEHEQNRKVVNAILNLAESLDINVIAEGIETHAQRDYFRERRCKGMQGWLFAKALPIEELEHKLLVLRKNGRRHETSHAQGPASPSSPAQPPLASETDLAPAELSSDLETAESLDSQAILEEVV